MSEPAPTSTDPPPVPSVPGVSTSDRLARYVSRRVGDIQRGYVRPEGPTSSSVGTLAQLRRALGAAGGADPRSWAIVLGGFPEELIGPPRGSLADPNRAEIAAMSALTTYAVHQQSQRQPMHVPGVSLGEATRRVAVQRARADAPGGLDDATVQRLHRVSMAHTQAMRDQALRALVTLMRSAERPVPLDYGRLAADLYWLQQTRHAARVHLAWARGLHTRSQAERVESADPSTQEQHDLDQAGAQL